MIIHNKSFDQNYSHSHTTKDGEKILLYDLELTHLKNIIARIERLAREGMTGRIVQCDSSEPYEEVFIQGDEVLDHFHYSSYLRELERRNKLEEVENGRW